MALDAMPRIESIRDYFERAAGEWDSVCQHDPAKLEAIVTLAGIRKGSRVLDAACGTGVLFPALLARDPAEILGVDLSEAMILAARRKCSDPRVRLTACDLYRLDEHGFDTVTIYSAYPHFPDKKGLADRLRRLLTPGGRFIVAHSEGRGVINGRHSGSAAAVSIPLRPAAEEAAVFLPCFNVDIIADTPDIYLISGVRKPDAV